MPQPPARSDTAPRSPAHLVVALLLPLLLLAGAAWWLGRPLPRELGPTARRMEAQLAAQPPRVLLLGNSHVGRAVDPEQLARELDLEPGEVQLLFQVSSRAPVWYAILRSRVFDNGHRPEAVVIVEPLKGLTGTAVSGKAQEQLEEQADPADPVIARKVYGRQAAERGAWRNASVRRAQLRSAILDGSRDLVAGLLAGVLAEDGLPEAEQEETPEGLLARGRSLAEPAMERLFAAEQLWPDAGRARVIPVVEEEAPAPPAAGEVPELSGLEATFVPDLVELAQAHDAHIVFAEVPMAPAVNDRYRPPESLRDRLLGYFASRGVGHVDLMDLPLPAESFADPIHMNAAGRRVYTTALAEALLELGVLEAELDVERAILPESVRREGRAAELALENKPERLERGCAWSVHAPAVAAVSERQLKASGAALGSPVVLLEDGQPLASREAGYLDECSGQYAHKTNKIFFSPSGDDPEAAAARSYRLGLLEEVQGAPPHWALPGTRLIYEMPAATPGMTLEVVVHRLSEGRLQLRVDEEDLKLQALGERLVATLEAPTEPFEVELHSEGAFAIVESVRGTEGEAGTTEQGAGIIERIGQAPTLSPPSEPQRMERGCAWWLNAPEVQHLADKSLSGAGIQGSSPVVLWEDGQPLSYGGRGYLADCRGEYRHKTNRVFFSPTGDKEAAASREYRLVLTERVMRGGGAWLYPGTSLRQTWQGGPPVRLQLRLYPTGPGRPEQLTLRVGGRPIPLEAEGQQLRATVDLPGGEEPLPLEIRAEADAPYVWVQGMDAPIVEQGAATSPEAVGPGPATAEVAATEGRPVEARVQLEDGTELIRTGRIPALPAIAPPRRMQRGCAWQARAPELAHVASKYLQRAGAPASSPLVLLEDGQPLQPAESGYLDDCVGQFTHKTTKIFFSPTGDDPAAAASRTYALQLPDAPRDAQGHSWVYPGTTLSWVLPAGATGVHLRMWLRGEGEVELRAGGQPVAIQPDGEASTAEASGLAAGDRVELSSPAGGPYVLVQLELQGARP